MLYGLVLCGGAIYFVGVLMKEKSLSKLDPILFFMFSNVVYIFLVTNILDIGENNRFRFMSDPFVLILAVIGVSSILKKIGNYRFPGLKNRGDIE